MVAYSISNNGDSRMRTFAKKSTGSADSEGGAPLRADKSANGDNWFRKHWCGLTLLVIVVVAFLLRFCFAYGISVGDNYALSGGSSAASHRRIINEILWGTYNPGSESALNYPYGVESIFGPLYDYCCAAWAKLFTVFVKDYDLCAGAALAVNPPIFGALTCIPVFMIADKMFKGDKMIALLAAAFYAVFAVLIMTTPFSYGTETAFVAFLIAGLVYFLVTAFSVVDGKIMLPFNAVNGIGDTAAESRTAAYAEKPFSTLDDVRSRTRLTGTNIEDLKKHGLFEGLPESAQISIFDL